MNWINENAGVIILVAAIVILVLLGISVWLLFYLKNRIAVQRLSFLGFYSASVDTGIRYADFTVGNKSLQTVGISELGLKNGKVAFNLTQLYREKAGLPSDAKLVVGQRSSVTMRLTLDELKKVALTKEGKKVVGALRMYVVDFAGTLYQGRVNNVRKLLKELLAEEERPMAASAKKPQQPAATPAAPASKPEEEKDN